jgi:hypothetical protein
MFDEGGYSVDLLALAERHERDAKSRDEMSVFYLSEGRGDQARSHAQTAAEHRVIARALREMKEMAG